MAHFLYGCRMRGKENQHYGPHVAKTLDDAIDALTNAFELYPEQVIVLRGTYRFYFHPGLTREYCEITVCTCAHPWIHETDPDSPLATPEGWQV